MSYFDKLVNFMRKNISDYPPFQLVEVRPEDYARYEIIEREDPIICYSNGTTDLNETYEIVVLKDLQSKTAYSLIRCKVRTEIETYFRSLSGVLPPIFFVCPNLTNELLQDITSYVREHLDQSLAHVCAHFGLNDYFKQLSSSDTDIINNQSCESGLTPLHIAVRTGRLSTVQAILALSPKLDLLDRENNNCLHFASATNKDIISKLCQTIQNNSNGINLMNLINSRNRDNFSPLYLAAQNDKTDCIIELLKNGADPNGASIVDESRNEVRDFNDKKTAFDQLDTKGMKNGGTPLHWAVSSDCIELMLEMGCHIDARNFQGETALHLMIMRNKLSCVITLLSYGADVSATGPNGQTPLHLAVKSGQAALVQAVIVFGADVNMQNSSGESARHLAASAKRSPQMDLILYILHSVGAQRCATNRSNCTDGCSQSNSSHFNGIPPESSPFKRSVKLYNELLGESIVKEALNRKKVEQMSVDFDMENKKRHKILSLDGGGVRGLIIIQMLWVLEVMMNKKMGDTFDWISGTSTGGILALLLAAGHSAGECRRIYFKLKDKVFTGSRPYDSEPLEKFLQKNLGEDSRMGDIKKPKIMITATVADRFPPDLQLFRNYESPNEIVKTTVMAEPIPDMPKPQDQLIWQTARSSGAAPTYFRPVGSFLDGGLISNNPTLDTLTEIHWLNKSFKFMNRESEVIDLDIVVSLGTGAVPIKQVPIIDIYRPSGLSLPSVMGVAKMVIQTPALLALLVEQACQSDGQVVERAKAWCSQIEVPYFRLNPPLSEDINLNETDNIKLVNMLWETTAYMHSRSSELEELISLLFD